jgi:hypothetical protein
VLEVDTLLNLGELRLDPGVVLITMSVEFGQGFQTFFGLVLINEPARGLSYIGGHLPDGKTKHPNEIVRLLPR